MFNTSLISTSITWFVLIYVCFSLFRLKRKFGKSSMGKYVSLLLVSFSIFSLFFLILFAEIATNYTNPFLTFIFRYGIFGILFILSEILLVISLRNFTSIWTRPFSTKLYIISLLPSLLLYIWFLNNMSRHILRAGMNLLLVSLSLVLLYNIWKNRKITKGILGEALIYSGGGIFFFAFSLLQNLYLDLACHYGITCYATNVYVTSGFVNIPFILFGLMFGLSLKKMEKI